MNDKIICFYASIRDYHFKTNKLLFSASFKTEKEARKWLLDHEQATDLVRTYKLYVLYALDGWKEMENYTC